MGRMLRHSLSWIVLAPLMVSCAGLGAKIDLGYMQVEPSGSLALESGSGGGGPSVSSNNDINDDLGVATKLDSLYARVELDAGLLHFTGSGYRVKDQASGTLRADFGSIPANTAVRTDLDLQIYKVAATLDLIDIGPVRISPGLAADIVLSNTSIAGASVAEDLDGTIPVPMLFVQGEVDFSILEMVVDLGWLDGNYGNYSGNVLDAEAMLRVKPLAMLQVFVGYRATLLDISRDENGDSDRIDLDFRGWTAGVGVQF